MITSKDNRFVKLARSLQQKKERDKIGLFLIEGSRNCQEALAADIKIKYALSALEEDDRLSDLLKKKDIPVIPVMPQVLNLVSDTCHGQGLLLVAYKNELTLEELLRKAGGRDLLLLDGISDPGNMGTMVRSAYAAGMGGLVVFSETVDIYSPKVVRAAMGALYHLPVAMAIREEALFLLKSFGYEIVGADMSGTAFREFNWPAKMALVMGREADGLDYFWQKNDFCRVSIPMFSDAESLNVAVAASIIMFVRPGAPR